MPSTAVGALNCLIGQAPGGTAVRLCGYADTTTPVLQNLDHVTRRDTTPTFTGPKYGLLTGGFGPSVTIASDMTYVGTSGRTRLIGSMVNSGHVV